MSDSPHVLLSRRRAIQGAASLIGASIATAQLGPFMSRAAAATENDAPPAFFDAAQFALLEAVVDTMIPETGTPGARTAGVHHFIDLMMSEWASTDRQTRYVSGLEALASQLQSGDRGDFVSASATERLDRLRAVDARAFTDDGDAFYRELKRMVLFAYYSSEAGATVELQYEALTPEYQACAPIDDVGRTWFWLGFSHGL